MSVEVPVRADVPGAALETDQPLVAVYRGQFVNTIHRGVVCVTDVSGTDVLAVGNREQPVFLRSAAKPIQIMPAVLSGGVDRFGITERELAVLCSSHHAESRHTEAVLSVLTKIGLDEASLRCGVHPPIDAETAQLLVRKEIEPSPVYNNCSGAHTGMLIACLANGWDTENYGRPDHPLQRAIVSILAAFSDLRHDAEIDYATDNCAVPTFRLPLHRAAKIFARLAAGHGVGDELGNAAHRVVKAMTAYPEMIGGEHSFDTAVMRVARGSLVCKGGAEGFQGIGSTVDGLGLAMKISDGDSRAIPPVAVSVLRELGLLDDIQQAALANHASPDVRNHQDTLVGRMVPLLSFRANE